MDKKQNSGMAMDNAIKPSTQQQKPAQVPSKPAPPLPPKKVNDQLSNNPSG